MSHTPGPWYDHMLLSVACENDGEYGNATCITTTPEDEYASTGVSGDWIAFVPHDRNHAANARLIAAAPALLEMLRRGSDAVSALEADCDEHGIDCYPARHWWQDADRLIAKAEGRERC